MKAKLFGIYFFISYPAVAFLSLALICDNRGTVSLCLLSSVLHELGHLTVMCLCGVKVQGISINIGDIAIKSDLKPLSFAKEFLVNISGVAVNFTLAILAVLFWYISTDSFCFDFAMVNLCIGLFNLLPVRYLDGGQLLMLFISRFCSLKRTELVLNILTFVFVVPFSVFGLLGLFNSSYNYSLLFVTLYLICTIVSKEFK